MHSTGRVRIGIIGSGRIGRIHAENLCRYLPEADVVAVTDAIPRVAEICAKECGILHVFPDYRLLLEREDIEAVVICSSTESHGLLIEKAAAAGKHIFCEKPIALDLKAIDTALAAVAQAGVKLQIGFQRRFDPSFRKVHDLVQSGQIGAPYILRITSRDPEPPPLEYIRNSGGIFLDMTIHDFDMARFLLNDEVEEVFACGTVLVDETIGRAGDFDTAVVNLKFRHGALAVIDNCRKSAYGYDQRIEVHGSRGMVSAGNQVPDTTITSDTAGIHQPLPLHFFLERYQEAYREEMKSFLSSILLDQEPEVTGADGRAPVVMAHAALLSVKEKRPVKLSEVEP
ncbi:MAG: inositol 2-dehydrogenase [Candidatus Abyssobacteria bacterium SURF_5]|uniref:Inositol 2-dehydrogenase n=1 Tax=Abyssobacteria bacterium (strain SURF_5) TaxID=2093360 RepID=A0A3A4NNZ6_ABYX5|nr:MAG: inositol 2-dehydrogenase [Candidatus Abyssubacteria bacterium SURF_5]